VQKNNQVQKNKCKKTNHTVLLIYKVIQFILVQNYIISESIRLVSHKYY